MSQFVMQSLESRRLLAAISVTLAGGKLTVKGTSGADSLLIGGTANYDGTLAVYDWNANSDGPIATFKGGMVKSLYVDLGSGNDSLDLEEKTDAFGGVSGITLLGGGGDDTIYNGQEGNYTDGGDGNDDLFAGGTVKGGKGNDKISGYVMDDQRSFSTNSNLDGGDGNDTISGNGGSDTLTGGIGDDTLYTTTNGTDGSPTEKASVDAGAGNDKIYFNSNGTARGGSGNDRIYVQYDESYEVKFSGITVYGDDGNDYLQNLAPLFNGDPVRPATLIGGNGVDSLTGNAGNDNLQGNADNDQLRGNGGNDKLDGGTGNDQLYGGDGNDTLYGGDGQDTLSAGSGVNRLYGQNGRDTLQSKNGKVDELYATSGDVLDRDSFDVLKA